MTRARASALLRIVAAALVVLAIMAWITAGKVAAGERELVEEAERHVVRHDLDQENPEP